MLRLPLNGFSVIRVSGEVCIRVLEVSGGGGWRQSSEAVTSNPHLHCTSEVALRPVSRQGCSGHHWAAKPNPDTNTETQPQTENTDTQTHCLTNCHLAPRNPKHTRTHPASVRSNINMNVNTRLDSDILLCVVYVCVECMDPCLQSAVSVICDMLF